jgi:hypothetical protein
MDLNPNSLKFASRRISRHRPAIYVQNTLESINHDLEPFDSIGMNYLFHCAPGSMAEKAVAFDHLRKLMKPACKVFGSTILQGGVPRSRAARRLMKIYNEKGIFANTRDDLEGLEHALSSRFMGVATEVVGCVALFSGQAA